MFRASPLHLFAQRRGQVHGVEFGFGQGGERRESAFQPRDGVVVLVDEEYAFAPQRAQAPAAAAQRFQARIDPQPTEEFEDRGKLGRFIRHGPPLSSAGTDQADTDSLTRSNVQGSEPRNMSPSSTPVRTRSRHAGEELAGAANVSAVEAQLAALQARLDTLRAQVRQAQQLAHLGTAAATIAHEVNNLLTPIYSYAKYALEADEPDLYRKALTVTCRNTQMLVAMSERVLSISAAKPAAPQAVKVREAALLASESLCRDVRKDGLTLVVEVDDDIVVQADPLHVQQVFFNLFLNARSAMAPQHQGRLVVCAGAADDRVRITVRDTGPGIAPELLPHIFDALQSSKPLTAEGPQRCAGLGLALCRDLVTENGGTIVADSVPGGGTTFTIDLPAAGSTP